MTTYPIVRWEHSALPGFVFQFSILAGAMLVALQMRFRLPWGKPLGAEYDARLLPLLGLMLAGLCLSRTAQFLIRKTDWLRQLVGLLAAVSFTAISALLFLPGVSKLQLVYFIIFGAGLGIVVIGVPARFNKGTMHFTEHIRRLWQSRFLLTLWLRYNIQARYSQMILGILWIVMLPLATSFVLALAFRYFLKIQLSVPFISFFLAALIPWGLFNQSLLNGTRALLSGMGLITQVGFPREVLVILALAEALVDFIFAFAAMLIVNGLNSILPNGYYIYLPFLALIILCFSLGLMLFLSCLNLFVRDIPQLVAVALQLLFYLTPILYPAESIPDQFRILTLLNPLSGVIQAFRDVIVYARPPDMLTLCYPLVISIVLLYIGYCFFKANEGQFADLA